MWFPVLYCCVTTMLSQECLRNFPDLGFFCGYTKLSGCFITPLGFLSFYHEKGGSNMRCSQTLTFSNASHIQLHVSLIPASSAKPEPVRRENARKGSVVNVNPTNIRPQSDSPEIRKYKKKFNSEVLCAALWGKLRVPGQMCGGKAQQERLAVSARQISQLCCHSPGRECWRGSLSWYLCHLHGPAFPGTRWQTHELQLQRTWCIRMRKGFDQAPS